MTRGRALFRGEECKKVGVRFTLATPFDVGFTVISQKFQLMFIKNIFLDEKVIFHFLYNNLIILESFPNAVTIVFQHKL
jgi:hypothetical protein